MGRGVVHFEIGGQDADGLQSFYAKQFGWKITGTPMGYGIVDTKAPAKSKGINGGISGPPPDGPESWVTFYVEVPSIDASLSKIEAAGGTTVVPRTVLPGMVTFAQFADPSGNVVGLVESDVPAEPKKKAARPTATKKKASKKKASKKKASKKKASKKAAKKVSNKKAGKKSAKKASPKKKTRAGKLRKKKR